MKCKICKNETDNGFNINFKVVPICRWCESRIVFQSVQHKYATSVIPSKEKKK